MLFHLDLPILFIMGGTSSIGTFSSVETVDLREDASCTVEEESLPEAIYANIGVVDRDGNPMSCGGTLEDPSQCIMYNMELDEWVDGPSMNYERDLGGTSVRLSDGRYFVIGTGIPEE